MKNMKTLKNIVFAAIALFGLASCSDEKKALNYVSEEIVSDNELTDFLIKYNILMFKDSFEPELRYYLSSISDQKRSYLGEIYSTVYLSKEFAHIGSFNYVKDKWTYYRAKDSFDSDIILNDIIHSISKRLDAIMAERTVCVEIFSSNDFNRMSKEKLFNYILSKAVEQCNSWDTYEELDSITNQLGLSSELYEHRILVNYEWLVMGIKNQQGAFIDEVVNWIVSKCRDEVMSKNYKLVDKQCTTVGENQYNVTYLLEPQLEINFSVKKVGKTFVCENYSIDGNVINL